jgi:hypothetical protein
MRLSSSCGILQHAAGFNILSCDTDKQVSRLHLDVSVSIAKLPELGWNVCVANKVRDAWKRTLERFRLQKQQISEEWDAVYILSAAKAKYDSLCPSQESEAPSSAEVTRRASTTQARLGIAPPK